MRSSKQKFVAFREFEQQRELRETGLQSGVDPHGHSVPSRVAHSEEVTDDQTYKVLLLFTYPQNKEPYGVVLFLSFQFGT